VLAAVAAARDRGAKTIYLTMNPRDTIDFPVDVAICPVVGPEVLAHWRGLGLTELTEEALAPFTARALKDLSASRIEEFLRKRGVPENVAKEHAADLFAEIGQP